MSNLCIFLESLESKSGKKNQNGIFNGHAKFKECAFQRTRKLKTYGLTFIHLFTEGEEKQEEKAEKKEITVTKKTKPATKSRKGQASFSHPWLASSLKGHR